MFEIASNERIAPLVHKLSVRAAKIARKRRAGQFVIVRVTVQGERIPLTIADSDPQAGTITLIVQAVGRSTTSLCQLQAGESIRDVVGPLGRPTHIEKFGRVVIVGGGIGTAVALPIVGAMKAAGNDVSAIIGGRSRELIILEKETARVADRVIVCTDDGSYGRKGLVTEALGELIDQGPQIDLVVAIGPVPMMQAVCELTRAPGIRTEVSLNPIMIDGTGMCGGCRVTVGGQRRFACVDGPEFDGHQVDFTELRNRLGAFRDMEAEARGQFEEFCRLDEQARKLEGES
ncbi:MAG: sulfide/dihydroorotate dehydrogenase-like FAD/NAD-binding protein [Anaerolineaceae bacterium]|nr:sulfide/dihydroorotate dehydrogenase-like FAD/NAD-binding protein [Anaerolineaceae bacterium]